MANASNGVTREADAPRAGARIGLGLTISTILLVVVFLLLAAWQWTRVFRPVDGYTAEPAAMPLAQLLDGRVAPDRDAASRLVTLSGTYLAGAQRLVAGHSLDGAPVTWVITPLRQPSGSVVDVVRGWTAPGAASLDTPPTSAVAVTARVELGAPTATTASPAPNSFYLIRTAQLPPDPLSLQPVPTSPKANLAPREFHLQNAIYVVQWGLLACVVVFAWFRLRRAEAEALRDAGAEATRSPA